MGVTQEKVGHTIRLTRYILAGVVFLFTIIASLQLMLFPVVTIKFETGADAQQIEAVQVRKGEDVDLPTPHKAGSYFVGWSTKKNETKIIRSLKNVRSGATLYAVWDGLEKYSVLMVNGVIYRNVPNVFATKNTGVGEEDLNNYWLVLDDKSSDQDDMDLIGGNSWVNYQNNFQYFQGWRYRNVNNFDEELRYENGDWYWYKADENGNLMDPIHITGDTKFFPPNYRTVFNAILDYRKISFQIWLPGESRPLKYQSVDPNSGTIVMPDAPKDLEKFSHWKIMPGTYSSYVEEAGVNDLINDIPLIYEANEIVKINPLMYYLGNTMTVTGDGATAVIVRLMAVTWDDNEALGQFVMENVTDTGSASVAIPSGTYEDLVDSPIIYTANAFKKELIFAPASAERNIVNYTFYDHRGVLHEISTNKFSSPVTIRLDDENAGFAGTEVYFSSKRAIKIKVVYESAVTPITLRFNYGSGLISLPNYVYQATTAPIEYFSRIGSKIVMPNAEKYLRNDWLFYGWRWKNDPNFNPDTDEEYIYCAGESFEVKPFDTANVGTTLEFEAVWRMSRLLYDFDFGGDDDDAFEPGWAEDETPDFSLMKGVTGDMIQIVPNVPVRFGYIFLGWYLNDENDLIQPGEEIVASDEIQTLHARWRKKDLVVKTNIKNSNSEKYDEPWVYKFLRDKDYVVGDEIKLPYYKYEINAYYWFNGWHFGKDGKDLQPGNAVIKMTPIVIHQLKTYHESGYIDYGDYIEVNIYADLTERSVSVKYYVKYTVNVGNDEKDIIEEIIPNPEDNWPTMLSQGDCLNNHQPFNEGNTKKFDMKGGEFKNWEYAVDEKEVYTKERKRVREDTVVPYGASNINIYPYLERKNYTLEYYGYNEEYNPVYYTTDTRNYSYIYSDTLDLLIPDETITTPKSVSWGKFVGWSFEEDNIDGNPEIIYDVCNNAHPSLLLSDIDDRFVNSEQHYRINVDAHDEKISGLLNYRLKLYAVYALDYVNITYNYTVSNKLSFPVFSGTNRDVSVTGGLTVDPNDADFDEWGLVVRDDADLDVIDSTNFVGWEAELPANANKQAKQNFNNRLLFPGENLPSIDFNITFIPRYVSHGRSTKQIGNKTYCIVSLTEAEAKRKQIIENDTDYEFIVAFPSGNYTVATDNIVITSRTPVHVIVPANGNIELEPRAIKCDQMAEFYVGENLKITGSPVYGENFRKYNIRKGYHKLDSESENPRVPDMAFYEASTKYNYQASKLGLLVGEIEIDIDGEPTNVMALLGVPSHVQLTSDELFACLDTFDITYVATNALLGINTLSTINLAVDNLAFGPEALFSSTAEEIILPIYSDMVADDVISGWHCKLQNVYFGAEKSNFSNYGAGDFGYVFYGLDGRHVMYVMAGAGVSDLGTIRNNLRLPEYCVQINKYALAGRLSENSVGVKINSIQADNNAEIDLRDLVGLTKSMPVFVNANNTKHRGCDTASFQTYVKKIVFTCGYENNDPRIMEYEYGKYFMFFDPKDNNPHGWNFEHPWYKFNCWLGVGGINDRYYVDGKAYRVGIDQCVSGFETITFDASEEVCWDSYAVRFHVYDDEKQKVVEYCPAYMRYTNGNTYTIEEINEGVGMDGMPLDFRNIYLPGIDSIVDIGSEKYQFVGWGVEPQAPYFDDSFIWSSTPQNLRILPDKTRASTVSSGVMQNNKYYNFYALYDRVSDNLSYEYSNGSYTVRKGTNNGSTSICIPFAKYRDGYMAPVTRVADNAFSSGCESVNEIIIGGAVSVIGNYAFFDIDASITFQQQGSYIEYNNSGVSQLTIGEHAFFRNDAIDLLKLPASLVGIGNYAFASCSNLQGIVFEAGSSPALKRLGNFVFSDAMNLQNNTIVSYLNEDVAGKNQRFESVGYGIFMNTKVKPTNTNKIVWLGKLLYVYGATGSTFRITEDSIEGYALKNINDEVGTNVTEIVVENPNITIKNYAFSELSNSIRTINLIRVNPKKIELDAFKDITRTPKVTIRIGEKNKDWEPFLKLEREGYIQFS